MANEQQTGSGSIGAMSSNDVQAKVLSQRSGTQNLRDMAGINFTQNTLVSAQIPNNTSIKSMIFTLIGGFTATYASGTPLASPLGVFSRLAPNIQIKASASRTIKALDFYMQRCMNAIYYGGMPTRAYKKGATLVSTTTEADTEWLAGPAAIYGTTTQDTIINEAVRVDFEIPLAWKEKSATQFYTRDLTDPRIEITFATAEAILQDGNSAPVVLTNVSFQIVPSLVEDRQALPVNNSFDFVETILEDQIPSAVAGLRRFQLNSGQRVIGLGFLALNGDTNKNLSNTLIKSLNVKTNGINPEWEGNFRSLNLDNKTRYGVSDSQQASGDASLEGFGYISFIKDGDPMTGLDARPEAGVQTLDLYYGTNAASGIDSKTFPARLKILQQTLVPVVRGNG